MALNYSSLVASLETRYASIVTEIAALTATPPDYGIDGQSVTHSARIKLMYEQLDLITAQINALQPWFHTSRARPG